MTAVMIGTPCFGGMVTMNYMHCVMNTVGLLKAQGIDVHVMTTAHDSLIPRARNYIANEFLRREKYSHLLFIDADIEFAPETVLRFLRADKDVLCGIYPVKNLDIEKLRSIGKDVAEPEAVAASMLYAVKVMPGQKHQDGFIRVKYGATGFMLVKREVLTRLAEAYPELQYGNSFIPVRHERRNCAFFDTAIDPETSEYLPEDYAFCRRWSAIGGEVHADLFSNFSHVGHYVYPGNFTAFLTHLGASDPDRDR